MNLPTAFAANEITGLVLAGGRGSRMGGVDKGLQPFNGVPLAMNALSRLRGQVGAVMVNANRNLPAYEAFGAQVWPDSMADYAGPLAGFLTGLEHCRTPCLLTVPCDTPLFPLDLAARLAEALRANDAEIAMVDAEPVFCLLRTTVVDSLRRFTADGGRKVEAWVALQRTVRVRFDRPGDAADAFFNANTLAELHALEAR